MSASPFTVQAIGALKPGQTLRDDVVPGLMARHRGKIGYYLWFRTKGEKERRPRIGDFDMIPIAAARRIAREMLVIVAAGGDPVAERDAANEAPTISMLCDRYMERHGPKKAAKSRGEDQTMIDRFVKPRLGKIKIHELRMIAVEDLHRSLEDRPYLANRLLALVSSMMGFAEKWELRPLGTNPCQHVTRFREHKRRRYLSREEAGGVVAMLHRSGNQYPEQVAFLWLLIYTGARPAEIAALEPKHREGAKLTLTEHKTGKTTGDVRTIYLPDQALSILDALPKNDTGTLIGIKSPRNLWVKIRAAIGSPELRMYDLRHTFASLGLSNGLTLPQIGELMGHKSTATTSRYAHLIDETAKEAVAVTANAFDAFAKPKLTVVK